MVEGVRISYSWKTILGKGFQARLRKSLAWFFNTQNRTLLARLQGFSNVLPIRECQKVTSSPTLRPAVYSQMLAAAIETNDCHVYVKI